MGGATAIGCARGWCDDRRPLYHGIPARIAARGADPEVVAACWRLWEDADAVFNVFAAGSELARLNALEEQDGTALSPLLADGLAAAIAAWRLSRGACDAAAGGLVALWRAAVREQRWPGADEVARARAATGLAGVTIDQGRLRCPGRRLALDLGGVIKGVLVDSVDALLRAAGIADALVQIGGETSCRGRAPSGRAWRIGVQHPLTVGAWTALAAPPAGLSCSTSGDYRRDWRIAGRGVSHLVDPRSGWPADDDLLAATIVVPAAGRAGDAEALTKAAVFLPFAEAAAAAATVGAEAMLLRAADDGVEELATRGWNALEAA